MKIIPATSTHIPQILELEKYLIDYHKKTDPMAHLTRRKDEYLYRTKRIRRAIKSKDAQVLVAVDTEKVIAHSVSSIYKNPPVYRKKRYGFIGSFCVTPNYQRKGIGKMILKQIYCWFKARRISRIELSCAVKNRLGQSFWKKQGFQAYSQLMYLNKEFEL